ncbi:unnamed protein product [Pleuronectes platessa]|uniref:Uncharacterized protein n=1 Tax=Pleuronectes platessa TaxID=8262 RepID=A0A9N7Z8J9_PLEPL|nr:unnamed protein product [Pleuronectes platessa]
MERELFVSVKETENEENRKYEREGDDDDDIFLEVSNTLVNRVKIRKAVLDHLKDVWEKDSDEDFPTDVTSLARLESDDKHSLQSTCTKIAHRSRGSAPRPAHSLRDTRPELLHVKELSAAPINDFGPQRPPECSEQHGYNAKFQQFPDI